MIIPYSLNLDAQSASGNAKKQTYRKARVLQSSTAKKIQKVVEALERVDDEGKEDPDTLGAKAILTELLNNKDNLKSYDRSVMWNYWGYIYFSEENYDRAMNAYEQIIQEPEVTLPLRNSALFTLAQLYMVKGNFEKGIQILLEWMTQVDSVTAQAHSLLATAYFQVEDYINARDSMLEAVRLAEEVEEYRPKEQWYVLLTACYSQLADKKVMTKAQALNKNLDIFEILVNYYPKKISEAELRK